MITGANNNVRYRGIVFHVQTEDSGRSNPHIISHIYHGGTILASEKTDYSARMGDAEDLDAAVRGLIEAQHREMVSRLLSGGFDDVIAERLGDTAVDEGTPLEAPTPMPEVDEPTPSPVEPAADPAGPAAEAANASADRAFGEGIVSQKPLDEVILDYLANRARQRASGRPDPPERKPR